MDSKGAGKCARKICQTRSMETKEALTEAATKLFAELGYYKVNTKEIAKAAGVSIGTFYGYYADKKEVLLEIVQTYKESLLNAGMCGSSGSCNTSGVVQEYTLEQVINYFINQKLEVAERYPLAFHLEINHLCYRDSEIAALLESYTQREMAAFMDYMGRYRNRLRVENLRLAAELIYQVNDNMIMAHLNSGGIGKTQGLMEEYKVMITRYLLKGD